MKTLFLVLISVLFISCHQGTENMKKPKELIVYAGTYTSQGSDGIYVYTLNMANGELTLRHSVKDIENPSFLALAPDGKYLYAVHELNNYKGKRTGTVRSFRIEPGSWDLTFLSEQPSNGEHPCHVAVTPDGTYVLLANYSSGSVSMFPVRDGVLQAASDTAQHVGAGPNPKRQQGPHAHSINISPDGRYAFAVDLGIDKIVNYKLDLQNGRLVPNPKQKFVQVTPGAGPRHFTFHPNGGFAYVINELGNSIVAYTYNTADGVLSELQTVSTLPPDFSGESYCADIHITPDGKFLYGSNRGHNSLAIFKISGDGMLQHAGFQSTLGDWPRNFAIDPTGTYLLAANQKSDNIVVFCINKETGELQATGNEVHVSMPVCIKMLVP